MSEHDNTHFLFLARKLRERAEEALTLADAFRDPEARRMMLDIAERDERLAQRLEHQAD
jgi:transcriptional regulator with AAA-type ATPase domain